VIDDNGSILSYHHYLKSLVSYLAHKMERFHFIYDASIQQILNAHAQLPLFHPISNILIFRIQTTATLTVLVPFATFTRLLHAVIKHKKYIKYNKFIRYLFKVIIYVKSIIP